MLLFTKTAQPGKVKTRLIGELTAEQAAELHLAFLEDIRDSLGGGAYRLQVAWAVAEGEALPDGGMEQHGAGLGERLWNGLREVAAEHRAVAAVGSDHPELSAERIEEAFARLVGGADVVLGPSDDGGYYLIGARSRSLRRELFTGIAWSTEAVLRQTRERCRELGLRVELLPQAHDIDTPEDLERLCERLRGHEVGCPATRRVLRKWGRL